MKVLRIVTLGSASGRYGGPFDTSGNQRALVAEIHDVTRLYGVHRGDEPPHSAGDRPVVVIPILRRYEFPSSISAKMIRQIWYEVQTSDIVHISFARELTPIIAAFTALAVRKPWIAQPHGMLTVGNDSGLAHKTLDLIARPLFKRAKAVIALTDREKDQLMKWSGDSDSSRYEVIGNPTLRLQEPSPKDHSKSINFVARLHPRKGVDRFIAAARIAHERGWPETYSVYGPPGPSSDNVTEALDLPNFSYGGALSPQDVAATVSNSGVFALPSSNEPWGNVLVTAIAYGTPVVVDESAHLASEIKEHHLGIVVDTSDPESLASACHHALSGAWRTTEQSEHAKNYSAARFADNAIAHRLLKAYEKSADSREGQHS